MPDICYIGAIYLLIGSFVPPDAQMKTYSMGSARDYPAHQLETNIRSNSPVVI
jgi:hypothetical protein